MAQLTFNPVPDDDKSYSAEFTATADFNLYIEFNSSVTAHTQLYVRNSNDQKYVLAHTHIGNVLNQDFGRYVYPVMIKVVTYTEPTKADYRYNG